MSNLRLSLAFLLVLAAAPPAFAGAPPAAPARVRAGAGALATARTRSLVGALRRVKAGPSVETANAAVFAEIDGYFNYDAFLSGAVRGREARLRGAVMKRYREVFRTLLREIAFADSGALLRRARLEIGEGVKRGDAVEVKLVATVDAEDFETEVAFIWRSGRGGLRIHDVAFDGASLVEDYKNQFARILDKDGGEALVRRMEARLHKLRAAGKGG